jgi:hypothetical protein
VLGDVEVHDAPTIVGEHDEDEEDAPAGRGHREEVYGDKIGDVVGKERPPRLRGRPTSLRHQPGDGALGDVDTELQEFSVDARGAPEWVRRGHPRDEGADLSDDAGPAD